MGEMPIISKLVEYKSDGSTEQHNTTLAGGGGGGVIGTCILLHINK